MSASDAARPRYRSRAYYCAVLALPIVVLALFSGTGQLQTAMRLLDLSPPIAPLPPGAVDTLLVLNVIWLLAIAPFGFAAWELGRHHSAARRLNYVVFAGAWDVIRLAFGAPPPSPAELEAYARSPRDRPGRALLFGLAVAALVPAFFLGFAPLGRSAPVVAWLTGAGALMGSLAYCRVRAAAYLVDEPGRWSLFREWQLLNPARYEPAGHRFVRWQIIGTVMLLVWWLGVGVVVMSRTRVA